MDHTDPDRATGRMFLADIYTGRNMEGIEPGQIKKLLVLEILPKPVNFSGGMDLTSWLGTFTLERVLGTVPVEADGSAYFLAPAGIPMSFQALDERGMAVQTMRSLTYLQPGERAGCVGCHEHRGTAPSSGMATLAAQREASAIRRIIAELLRTMTHGRAREMRCKSLEPQ